MTLSTGPWWWAPVRASGSMATVPAHSLSAPARAAVIAAARLMPGVCGVLTSSWWARTTRTPCSRQSGAGMLGAWRMAHADANAARERQPVLLDPVHGGRGVELRHRDDLGPDVQRGVRAPQY